jgi:hypothetical protein
MIKFKGWLPEHRHDEIIEKLEQSGASIIAIRAALAQSHKEFFERVAAMDRALASLASSSAPFKKLQPSVRTRELPET